MCGIVAYCGSRLDAAQIVLEGLKTLEYRGYDSWGVAWLNSAAKSKSGFDQSIEVEKQVGKIGTAKLAKHGTSNLAIGHTRWATHGGVTAANAHPHLDSDGRIALVHNGIVENYQELQQRLSSESISFLSETDTEVAAQLVGSYRAAQSIDQAITHAFRDCAGLNAWVVLDKASCSLIAIRHGSPLAIGQVRNHQGFMVASDAVALAAWCDQIFYLDEDELVQIKPNLIQLTNLLSGQSIKPNWEELNLPAEQLSLGEYPNFMIKEIHEQLQVVHHLATTSAAGVVTYGQNIGNYQPVFVGCGSAYHAALAATYLFSEVASVNATAHSGSEFSNFRNLMDSNYFVTFLSQSGETIDIMESVTFLQKTGVPFGAIVNRLGSSLERATQHKILLWAGPEQCVLATKSFTAKLAVLFLLAHQHAGTLVDGIEQLLRELESLKLLLQPDYLAAQVRPIAQLLSHQPHIFVIGRGLMYPMALEMALKIKEVTYLHAEGFAGGELKHGVIALIEPGTPCIILAAPGVNYSSGISNAIELKSRGATIVGLSPEPNEVFDHYLPVSSAELCNIISYSVVGQLIAYQLALLLGRDPDKPRNLAKSVTVK